MIASPRTPIFLLAAVSLLLTILWSSPSLTSARPLAQSDPDGDNDGVNDVAEQNCGGSATNPGIRPERVHDNFLAVDDDGDAAIDELLPPGASAFDCDGDGYVGSAEMHVFGGLNDRDQDPCGSDGFPADFVVTAPSFNRINVQDLASYIAPIRYFGTDVGTNFGDVRWDLIPGSTFGTDINIQDLSSVSLVYPPMLGGARAFGGPRCPWPVTANGYELPATIPTATFNRMVAIVPIPGAPNAAVVVLQQDQQVWRISLTGAFAPTLYGDLAAFAGGGGNEEGLLALRFSPDFQSDGRVYVYYTRGSPQPSVLSRFQVVGGVMDADAPGDETVIITVPQFADNHNGGEIAFGPDGYLYLTLGDGGSFGDPQENSQNLSVLLGKVLRLNVTGQSTYTIPPANPFADGPGGNADEIYAYGLRNPWRGGFDSYSGQLWLADVGQGAWEETDRIVSGANYGWDCYEGNAVYEPAGCGPAGNFTFPRSVYSHSLGCSVTGGYVYRGPSMPELNGWFIYGDYCTGRIWAVNTADGSAAVQLVDTDYNISSFGQLPDGEVVVLTFENAMFGDAIYRLSRD